MWFAMDPTVNHMYPKFRNISRQEGHPVQTWRFTVTPCIQILILNCTHSDFKLHIFENIIRQRQPAVLYGVSVKTGKLMSWSMDTSKYAHIPRKQRKENQDLISHINFRHDVLDITEPLISNYWLQNNQIATTWNYCRHFYISASQ